MKKKLNEIKDKTVVQLKKEIEALREEISLLILNMKVNPQKDSNLITKKRKKLAIMMTLLCQKS